MKYIDKLKNPKWQKKRLEILNRDEFKCCYCNDTETELQIHHLKYTKEPWDAPNENLITLCKDCHSFTTFNKKINVIEIIKQKDVTYGLIFNVKHNIKCFEFIELFGFLNNKYKSLFRLKVNGLTINNIIELNNGRK